MAKSTVKKPSVYDSTPPAPKKKSANTKAAITKPAITKAAATAPVADQAVKRRKVAFSLSAPQAREAAVAGTFNDWHPQPLKAASKDGLFSLTVLLTPGEYEYRFVVDGEWCSDASCPESVPNPYGAFNSLVRVA